MDKRRIIDVLKDVIIPMIHGAKEFIIRVKCQQLVLTLDLLFYYSRLIISCREGPVSL
jgi:hypothetical protein